MIIIYTLSGRIGKAVASYAEGWFPAVASPIYTVHEALSTALALAASTSVSAAIALAASTSVSAAIAIFWLLLYYWVTLPIPWVAA